MNDEEELKIKDEELRENLNNLIYQKLTGPEQEIVKKYLNFLKMQIGEFKMCKRDKEYYKERYQKEEEERLKTKKVLDKTIDTYNEVLKRLAKTEIDLEIAKAKIEILELEKEEMKNE